MRNNLGLILGTFFLIVSLTLGYMVYKKQKERIAKQSNNSVHFSWNNKLNGYFYIESKSILICQAKDKKGWYMIRMENELMTEMVSLGTDLKFALKRAKELYK